MFASCKAIFSTLLTVSILFVAILSVSEARGASQGGRGTCNGNECSLVLDSHLPESGNLCKTSALSIHWKNGSDVYLVQCDCDCSMQQNTNWVVDKTAAKVYGFSYGRYVNKSFLEGATADTEMPDRFAIVKLCQAPLAEKLESSTFVLLNKLPSEKVPPYCYEVTYVTLSNGSLTLSNNKMVISRNNQDYWMSEVSSDDQSALLSIVGAIQ
jgi:hypothetical protein